jgi:hypothetical protein
MYGLHRYIGWFWKKSPQPNGPDFPEIDSQAKAEELFRRGDLEKLYLMPLEFMRRNLRIPAPKRKLVSEEELTNRLSAIRSCDPLPCRSRPVTISAERAARLAGLLPRA